MTFYFTRLHPLVLGKLWELGSTPFIPNQRQLQVLSMASVLMAAFVCVYMGQATECVHRALDAKL
jgi:hypothetical protein